MITGSQTELGAGQVEGPVARPASVARPWAAWAALLLILLLGGYLRTVGLFTWDETFRLHPDERFYGDVASLARLPSSLGAYFDSARSPLNPRNFDRPFFVYGAFPILLARLVAEPLGMADYHQIYKVGRALSALFDLGSVLVIYLIGARLRGPRLGLLAALLLAASALPIQLSHFYTVDTFGAFFAVLALYWAVRAAQGGRWGSYAALGASVGLAMASSRVTMAMLGAVAVVAAVYAARRAERPDPGTPAPARPARGRAAHYLRAALLPLLLSGAVTLLTFRVFQPDAFMGTSPDTPAVEGAPLPQLHGLGLLDVRPEPRYLANIREIQQQLAGGVDIPPALQWVGQRAYLSPWLNMVLWGMGLPLGLLAWAGWAAAGWDLARRRGSDLLVPFAWVTIYFLLIGGGFVNPMRYMLPIYGALAILGAALLLRLWELRGAGEGVERPGDLERPPASPAPGWRNIRLSPRARRALGVSIPVVVILGTLAWAYGFSRIYTRPHTRIAASYWLLANAPPGAVITSEHWDDGLPLQVDGRDPWATLRGAQMEIFHAERPAKYDRALSTDAPDQIRDGILDQLDQASFVVLSSNRGYGSTVRLPARFPALMRYYQHLFSGELGFELAADISSYPSILGIPIPDQAADESFHVYDHPRVLIFRKTAAYSRERAEQLITAGVNWDEMYQQNAPQAHAAPTALRLTPDAWQRYVASGSWTDQFWAQGRPQALIVVTWLLSLQLLGLAAFALLFRALPSLPDRGYALSKTLGLLLVAYGGWALGSLRLVPFGMLSLLLCAAALVAGAFFARPRRDELLTFMRRRRTALIVAEALFLAAFAAMLTIRLLNPELWHPTRGGEKPMDLAFLTAVAKSPAFPPYDPWFAGGYINYYYFGFVLVATLQLLNGVEPAIAYNLAVPTIFALAAIGCWGVVYTLLAPPETRAAGARPGGPRRHRRERVAILSGLLAVLLVLIAGNLAQALWFLPGTNPAVAPGAEGPSSYAAAQIAQGRGEWAFWDATRLIPGTINEFPFFTFLFADLHAHMLVMPLSLAALMLMVALGRGARAAMPHGWRGWSRAAGPPLLLLAVVTGAIRVTNTWDYPVFTGLALASLALAAWDGWRRRRLGSPGAAALVWLGQAVALVALGTLLFLPFHMHFASESFGAELWRGDRTLLRDWLKVNGLWLFLLAGAGLLLASRRSLPRDVAALILSALVAITLVGAALNAPALSLLLPLGLAALIGLPMLVRHPAARGPLLWAATGLALSIAVELVAVKGDVGRMNTVFKFGLHGWMLFGLASAVALPWMWAQSRRWPLWAQIDWSTAALLLVGAALVYPLTATPARLADRYVPGTPATLDGAAFMRSAEGDELQQRFPLAPDADAIAWIQRTIEGTPLMLEAHMPSYRWAGRVATYTGLPGLLGWEWHEIQQRGATNATPVIQRRQAAIEQIYAGSDPAAAMGLIEAYGVQYIYLGRLERIRYGEGGLPKFAQLEAEGRLERVYDQGDTQIYRVVSPAPGTMFTTELRPAPPPPLTATRRSPEQISRALPPPGPALPAPTALLAAPAAPEAPPPVPAPAAVEPGLAELEAAVAREPTNAQLAYGLGEAYQRLGRTEDAVRVLGVAAEANPGDVGLNHLLADALAGAGRIDEAERVLARVAELQPTASNLNKLGTFQLAHGRLDGAVQSLRRATVIEPDLPAPYYYLGTALAAQGDAAGARAALERFLALAPDSPLSGDARRALEALP